MAHYNKGAGYERELIKILVSTGFAAVRVAGSGRARTEQPDVLAGKNGKTFAFECKYSSSDYKSLSAEEVNSFFLFCTKFGCGAYLAFRFPNTPWKFMKITKDAEKNVSAKKTDELLTIDEIT